MQKIDLTGQRFGMLYVKNETDCYISPNGHRKSMWNCHCDCGNDCVIMGSHLTTGHSKSCGCQQTKKLIPLKANDLTGRKFGMLTVMYRRPNRMSGKRSRVVWHCKCECGKESDVLAILLTCGQVKSCGCLSISHAERTMIDYLNNKGLKYTFQYFPEGLHGIGGGRLSFDFALYDVAGNISLLIELDGLQHYGSVDYFGGDKKYAEVATHDALKNEWAKERGIDLIRIDMRNCRTDESFFRLYDKKLCVYINELTNSLNIE